MITIVKLLLSVFLSFIFNLIKIILSYSFKSNQQSNLYLYSSYVFMVCFAFHFKILYTESNTLYPQSVYPNFFIFVESGNVATYFMFKCNQPVNCALGHNIFISIEIFRVHRTCGLVYDALCCWLKYKNGKNEN